MQTIGERHSELHRMIELVKSRLASPFDLVVTFLAAVARDDGRFDPGEPAE